MKITKRSLPALLIGAVCAFGSASCPAEDSDADKVEDTMKDAGDKAEEAGDAAKDAMEKAGD